MRLIPFIFSTTDAYVLEFGEQYIRFYRNRGLIVKAYSAWVTTTAYAIGDLVTNAGSYYRCLIAHTSGTFATDLTAAKWVLTLGADDLAYEIPTVFHADEVLDVHYDGVEDLLYICSEYHWPQKLVRNDHDDWEIDDAPIENGPFLKENTEQIIITPSGVSGSITLTAAYPTWVTATAYYIGDFVTNGGNSYRCLLDHTSVTFATELAANKWVVVTFAGIFTTKHIGALWLLTQNRPTSVVKGTFTSATTSASIDIQENTSIRVTTHGSWTGTLKVEKTYDGSTWDTAFSIDVAADDNLLEEFEETIGNARYRVNMSAYTSGSCPYNLTALTYEWHAIVKITGWTSAKVVTATVLNAAKGLQTTASTEDKITSSGGRSSRRGGRGATTTVVTTSTTTPALASTAPTKRWSEGAWSLEQGYPSTLTFFQQRIFLASKAHRAPRIWGSKNFQFENFFEGPDADDSLYFYLSTTKSNPIVWLASSSQSILIGTSYQSSSIQPVNIEGGIQTFSGPGGSGAIQPDKFEAGKLSGNTIIFIERQGQKVCQIANSAEVYNYMVVEDISVLAEHITKPSIVGMCFQQQPIPILWMWRSDGVVVSMVYSRVHNVAAFATHPMTNGFVESMCVIPSASTGQDEVWLVVRRTIDDLEKQYIECFNPIDLDADIEDCQYVDSSLTYEGVPALTISGLDHLVGQAVSILDNGYPRANQVVTAAGLITVAAAWVTAHAYIVGDLVTQGGSYYRCIVAHTSGTFATDLTAANWLLTTALKVIVGLPYTSTLDTLDLQFAFRNGSTKGKKIKVSELNLDLYRSGSGVKYGPDADNLIELDFGADLFSGIWPQQERGMPFMGGFEKEISVMITQDKPLPLVVRSIIPRVLVEGEP